ncbi:MAG TPA: hypothetical protein VIK75_09715 [Calditerricola sp.]
MPNRIIKESIRTSESLASISPEAERLFWRLVVSADDFGCFYGDPAIVLGQCMTAFIRKGVTDDDVAEWLDELAKAGLIYLYRVNDREYLHLRSWASHQRQRSRKPKFPLPPYAQDQVGPFTEERGLEAMVVRAITEAGSFNGEAVRAVSRQARFGDCWIDILVDTNEAKYLLELKLTRLTAKALNQIVRYIEVCPGRGILIGSGIGPTLDLRECRKRGIAVVTYDDNLSWTVVEDGGFLREDAWRHVLSRDSTGNHGWPKGPHVTVRSSLNEIRESGFENEKSSSENGNDDDAAHRQQADDGAASAAVTEGRGDADSPSWEPRSVVAAEVTAEMRDADPDLRRIHEAYFEVTGRPLMPGRDIETLRELLEIATPEQIARAIREVGERAREAGTRPRSLRYFADAVREAVEEARKPKRRLDYDLPDPNSEMERRRRERAKWWREQVAAKGRAPA